jgi:hypothetical protein
MEVPSYGRLLNEGVVNSLVVKGRQFLSTIGIMMTHDEILSNGADPSAKAGSGGIESLQEDAVFPRSDLSRGLL